MPQIDPKYVFWFGVWTNVLMLIATLGVDSAPPLVAQYAPTVQWVCAFFYKVNSVLLTAASGLSSNKPGPLVSVPVKAVIIVAVVIGALLMPNGAHAAGPKNSTMVAPISGNALPCDPAKLLPGCNQPTVTDPATGNPVVALLSKPMQDLANFIMAGFDDAVSLSTAVPELQDGNGQACWSMMKNYSVVLKQHPIPVTFHASADLEAVRLLNMAANKICQNAACTQVFTDAGNLINAALPLKMPLPNLTALCSQVPGIAIVTPTLPVVPMPTPSPTPNASQTP